MTRRLSSLAAALLVALACLCGCSATQANTSHDPDFDVDMVAPYDGAPSVEVNGNVPEFTEEELAASPGTEEYAPLDELGRCGTAFALVGEETMPTTQRGSISSIKPTGWHHTYYDCVDGGSLYNRCHLIAWCLSAEDANERNLITGTRYFNVKGMLPYEEAVADYVDDTGNHVLYKVTPVFDGVNLVASGVQMQAFSLEDDGAGISFNVYVYDVQPNIEIDYATGESQLVSVAAGSSADYDDAVAGSANRADSARDFVLNTRSKRFHDPACSGVADISTKNKEQWRGKRSDLIEKGYQPCERCKP